MGVGDDEVVQQRLAALADGQQVPQYLEDIDGSLAWGAADVHEHVLAAGQRDEGAVALTDVEKDDPEVRHEKHLRSEFQLRMDERQATIQGIVRGASDGIVEDASAGSRGVLSGRLEQAVQKNWLLR